MTEVWNTFIQVNIYGRTLRELQKEGIFLKSVLNDIGCSKTWIVEGNMYEGEEDSYDSDDKTMVSHAPTLSTTFASARIPRFSTPMVSKTSRLDLNFPESLSDIGSESDSDITAASDDERLHPVHDSSLHDIPVVQEIMNDLIQQALKMVDGESENTIRWESSVQSPSKKRQRKRRRHSVPESKKTNSLCAKTVKPPTEKLPKRVSMFACVKDEPGLQRIASNGTTTRLSEVPAPVRLETERTDQIYCNLSPVYFAEDLDLGSDRNVTQWQDPARSSFEHDEDRTLDQSDLILEDDFYSFKDDETVTMNFDHPFEFHTPPSPNLLPTSSILRKNTGAVSERASKVVSFKVQKRKKRKSMNSAYLKANKMHTIKCLFKDCEKTIYWKPKYGKIRLIDHALTHTHGKCLGCRSCEFTCVTVRQMRYHYEKIHTEKKMEGFGMLDVCNMPADVIDICTIWKTCYKDQLKIVGNIETTTSKRRRELELRRGADTEKPTDDEDQPSTSSSNNAGNNFFYFRRIH